MDLQRFLGSQLCQREAEIAVPELAQWYAEGEEPLWVVRGLTAAELARAREAAERSDSVKALIGALAGDGDKAAALRDAMGLNDDEVPADVSRRIEMLAAGSVNPSIGTDNRDAAVRLAETFPVTFYSLTNKIQELTGMGAEPGKRRRSGATPE